MSYKNNELLAEIYLTNKRREALSGWKYSFGYQQYRKFAERIKNAPKDIEAIYKRDGNLDKLEIKGIGENIRRDLTMIIKELEEENKRGKDAKRGKTAKRA